MKYLHTLLLSLSAAGIVLSAALPEADPVAEPIPNDALEARQARTTILLCRDANYGGCEYITTNPGVCSFVGAFYDDAISSALVGEGTACVMYRDSNCASNGAGSFLAIGATSPDRYPNLAQQNFNDRITSVRCRVA